MLNAEQFCEEVVSNLATMKVACCNNRINGSWRVDAIQSTLTQAIIAALAKADAR